MKLLPVLFFLSVIWSSAVLAKSVEPLNSFYRTVFQKLHRQPPLGEPTATTRADDLVETHWIEQKLDNFNENNNDTWQMRYISNSAYYQAGGPLFIYVGAEWEIQPSGVTTGHTFDMAKKHNGYIFYTEHRYYGQSHPTENLSTENMKYLSVSQALADLAHFVRTMKSTIPGAENSKVIMSGGSYAATMTTWFAQLYPDLVTGSWASSGPLLTKTNFYEYKEGVGQSILDVGGKECYDKIQNAFEQLQNMFKNGRIAEVKAMFKMCNKFDEQNDMDAWNFFDLISEQFSAVVQYAQTGDIERTCSHFRADTEDYISLAKYILKSMSATTTCHDMTYKARLDELMTTAYTDDATRQWTFQTCNEFGWFQTSYSKNQPFGHMFPVDFYVAMCGDLFGKEFTRTFVDKQVKTTNDMFGELNPNVKNIYYTQGSLDPWRAMGIYNTTIPLASHCMDLKPDRPSDNTFLRAARSTISELVEKWLKED